MTIVEMQVHMDCAGCESKIRRSLQRLEGIDNIDIDMRMQKVTVTGWADQKKVLKAVRKTGRRAELWPFPYNSEYHPHTNHFYHQYHPHEDHRHYFSHANHSSYNYYKHGYDGHAHGYYHRPSHSTILDDKARSMFSDDNPHACSIM